MQKFGFFDEVDEVEALNILQELQSIDIEEDKSYVMKYLQNGTPLVAVMGVAIDLLSENRKVIDSPNVIIKLF